MIQLCLGSRRQCSSGGQKIRQRTDVLPRGGLTIASVARVCGGLERLNASSIEGDTRIAIQMQERIYVSPYPLALQVLGQGTPTVVLETGSCWSGLQAWRKVMPEVSRFTRVMAYDRADLGGSDKAPTPRTWSDMVRDLRTLLEAAYIQGPFVLVGASIGGILIRLFTRHYARDIAGLVLVDGTHPRNSFDYLGHLLLPRADDSQQLKDFRRWFTIQTGGEPGIHVEDVECVDWQASLPAALALGTLGTRPLVVLTAGIPAVAPNTPGLPPGLGEQMHATWLLSQRDLATLSTKSTHILVDDSQHMIAHDRPDVVIWPLDGHLDAIRQVAIDVRQQHALTSRAES